MSRHANGPVAIRRRARGYCVEGPGFYVWDEDPREVTRVARELARGLGCELPAQRLPESSGDPSPLQD